jgi:hypothetical protein
MSALSRSILDKSPFADPSRRSKKKFIPFPTPDIFDDANEDRRPSIKYKSI